MIERKGAILVERRADTDSDEWAFIGGGLGEDEPILAALHREVREETGFEIADAILFGVFSDPTRIIAYPDGNICRLISVVFKVVPEGTAEPILSAESRETRFVPRSSLGFWPVQRPIRDAVVARPTGIVVA